jgi:hypothetical protein
MNVSLCLCCRWGFRFSWRLERSFGIGHKGLEIQGFCDEAEEGFETEGASAEEIDARLDDGPDD